MFTSTSRLVLLNGSYSFGQHSGIMEINPAWGDSVENCYPSHSFNNNLHGLV